MCGRGAREEGEQAARRILVGHLVEQIYRKPAAGPAGRAAASRARSLGIPLRIGENRAPRWPRESASRVARERSRSARSPTPCRAAPRGQFQPLVAFAGDHERGLSCSNTCVMVCEIHVVGSHRFPDKLLGIPRRFRPPACRSASASGWRWRSSCCRCPTLPERITMTEEELWALTRDKLAAAEEAPGGGAPFLVSSESGLVYQEVCGETVYLVKTVARVRRPRQGGGRLERGAAAPRAAGERFRASLPFAAAAAPAAPVWFALADRRSRDPAQRHRPGYLQRPGHLCWGMLPSSVHR